MCGPIIVLDFLEIAAAILRMHKCGHPYLKRQDLVALGQSYAELVPVTRFYCETCGFDSSVANQYHPGYLGISVAEKLRSYNRHQIKTNKPLMDEVKRLIDLVETDIANNKE